jgi:hypothetical protein
MERILTNQFTTSQQLTWLLKLLLKLLLQQWR